MAEERHGDSRKPRDTFSFDLLLSSQSEVTFLKALLADADAAKSAVGNRTIEQLRTDRKHTKCGFDWRFIFASVSESGDVACGPLWGVVLYK